MSAVPAHVERPLGSLYLPHSLQAAAGQDVINRTVGVEREGPPPTPTLTCTNAPSGETATRRTEGRCNHFATRPHDPASRRPVAAATAWSSPGMAWL